jgi:hypothetical protein
MKLDEKYFEQKFINLMRVFDRLSLENIDDRKQYAFVELKQIAADAREEQAEKDRVAVEGSIPIGTLVSDRIRVIYFNALAALDRAKGAK